MPKKKDPSKTLGERVREMRAKKKISLEGFAHQIGADPTYLERIEDGRVSPPVGMLIQISRALAIDSATLLSESKKQERVKSYKKRTKAYSYKNLTPGAEDKHLWAYLITLDPKKEHAKVEYKHEGEEFVYVMDGKVQVTVGTKEHELKKGASLHFMSSTPHTLKNLSTKQSKLLVVVYTP